MTDKRERHVILLLVGFLAAAGAIAVAVGTRATAYELSIYAATPLPFWIGVAIAMVAALLVGLAAAPRTTRRRLALGLATLAGLAVVTLPLLRGYYFHGAGDALSYLGWTRMMEDGRLNPANFMYPGIQSIAVFVATVTGMTLRRSLMLVVPVTVAVYVLFTGLTVARVAKHSRSLAIGTFAALLLLPINNVHTFLFPYPTSTAIFFTPFALYLLVGHLQSPDTLVRVGGREFLSPFGVLLVLAGVAAILLHPQAGSNVLLIVAAGFALQIAARVIGRIDADGIIAGHRSLAAQTLVIGAFFALWTPRFERATGTAAALVENLLTGAGPSEELVSQAVSLSLAGSGLLDLFLKLFLVSALFSLLAGVVMLALVTGRLNPRFPDRNALLAYFTAGFVPVAVLFTIFFIGSGTRQPFRYFGFMMVFVTIIAAVAISDGLLGRLRIAPENRTAALSIFFVALLVPQAAIMFQSPYMLQPSDHVPEQRMDGYEATFEVRDPNVTFAGVRGGPRRYVDAHFGTAYGEFTPSGEHFPGKRDQIPFGVFGTNTSEYFNECRYVPMDSADERREVDLYDGFRYSAEDFRSFRTDGEISKVMSNGDYELYFVSGSDCAA